MRDPIVKLVRLGPVTTAIIIATVVVFSEHAHAIELVENGSFEKDPLPGGAPYLTDWDDAPGVGNDWGFAIRDYPYYENGEFAGSTIPPESPPGLAGSDFTGIVRPAGGGLLYGFSWGSANGSGVSGSATQLVDLSEHAGKPFEYSVWLAGRIGDLDFATVTIEFFDEPGANGSVLEMLAFDGNDQASPFIAGSLNLDGSADPAIAATQDNWTLYRAVGKIPSTAASAAVIIDSFGNSSYVDLVSLQVVPEPSTAVLACLIGAVGAVWCVRRNHRS